MIEFAISHDQNPDFRKDISEFITTIFDIVVLALEEYDQYKNRRGLIDYTDMEVALLRLLEHPRVTDQLSAELDLLMVDEFQDTNPVQLEIFLKLSQLAKHSVWVGDPKQSIYGFRGAEPALMEAVIEAVGQENVRILDRSWRSREDLVHMVNALFLKAFPKLPVERIALDPVRKKIEDPIEMGTGLMHWHFLSEENSAKAPGSPWTENCIAQTIHELLEKKVYIFDKNTQKSRLALPGDIAILCRSNAQCKTVAEALHHAGLKAAIAREGLLQTPEACLILACLKYLLHPSDSLSVAEILYLSGEMPVEKIIHDRLDYLEEIRTASEFKGWASSHPLITKLDHLRTGVKELSGLEILDLILDEMKLRRIIAAWGKKRLRAENIDGLRKLALNYEEACTRLHTAASLAGLLLWLQEKADAGKDDQGTGAGPDSVNVLTYHKSKGLEWPIVICHSLEAKLMDKPWGLNVLQEKSGFDLNNPLKGRWMRYWINPYADQSRKIRLTTLIDESPVKAQAREKALAEEARLLYVGFTRARDYLVIASRKRPTTWLNRIMHEGEETNATLDTESYDSPWDWKGITIPIDTWVRYYPSIFPETLQQNESVTFLPDPSGKQSHELFEFTPEEYFTPQKAGKVQILKEYNYGRPPALPVLKDGVLEREVYLSCLLAFRLDSTPEENKKAIELSLLQSVLEEEVPTDELTRWIEGFYAQFSAFESKRKLYRLKPVEARIGKRLFRCKAELCMEGPAQSVYFFHPPFQEKKASNKQILKWGMYLNLITKSIQSGDRILVNDLTNGLCFEIQYGTLPGQLGLGL